MSDADGPPDRRASRRLEILGDLRGEIMVFQPMNVREISRRGVLVDTHVPLQVDSLHDVRLTLGPHALVMRGRVVHCCISDVDQEQVTYRSGLEFIEPTAHVDDVVAGFLRSVQAARQRQ